MYLDFRMFISKTRFIKSRIILLFVLVMLLIVAIVTIVLFSSLNPIGQIEYVSFPGGVFDDQLHIQYEAVWGPDWNPIAGLTSGTSQMARSGVDPERVVFNLPLEMVFSSTNVSGWPQLLVTVRAQNTLSGDALRGYSLFLMPPSTGHSLTSAPLIRPRAATLLGEWLAWITGKYPELAEPRMLAIGKDNYLLRTESYGSVTVCLNMVSKDFRKLGYDNQPPTFKILHKE